MISAKDYRRQLSVANVIFFVIITYIYTYIYVCVCLSYVNCYAAFAAFLCLLTCLVRLTFLVPVWQRLKMNFYAYFKCCQAMLVCARLSWASQ